MQQFSEIIKVDGHDLIFVFTRLRTREDDNFFVMVTKDAVTYSVELKKNKSRKWHISSPSPPNWFKRIEPAIVQFINDNTEPKEPDSPIKKGL